MDGFVRHRRDRRESTVSVLSALSNDVELCQENTISITNQIVIGAEFMMKIKAVDRIYSVNKKLNVTVDKI
jgi:hypothetical protein